MNEESLRLREARWRDDFGEWLRAPQQNLAALSVESYERALGVFAGWFELEYRRPFTPRQLTARDVMAYKHELHGLQGLKASSVNVALSALRALAKWALETGELRDNPAQPVSFVDLAPAPPKWMTRAELRRLMAELERAINDAEARNARERAWQAKRDMAVFALMAGAGLRVSEVAALDLEHVELKARSGMATIRKGKGGRETQAPLGAEVRKALHEWIGLRGKRPGALFTTQKGGRIQARGIQRSFAELARRAGLEGHTPHSLRHSFVKNLIDRQEPLTKVQVLARHRRVQTTARYAAPGRAELAAAVEGVLL